jgi:hypothetical protein
MYDLEKSLTTAITMFLDVPSRYETNLQIIKQTEEELNDLEHEIELSKPKNARKGYELYKLQRELLQRRREAKDENMALEDMYKFCVDSGNGIKARMQQIHGTYRKVLNQQKVRTYTPKQRTDLTITDIPPKAVKVSEGRIKKTT